MPDTERSGRFGCQTEIVHLHIHSHQAAGVLVREGERGNDPKPGSIGKALASSVELRLSPEGEQMLVALLAEWKGLTTSLEGMV